jgi:hypothetical protein
MKQTKIATTTVEKCLLSKFFTDKAQFLRLPTIQREFVWDAEDVKKLLDSIVQGYPIGSIIIWKPDVEFPSVPLMGEDNDRGKSMYILDGQQRLTSLLLIMNGWKLRRKDKEIKTSRICFIPESGRFYIGEKKGIDVSVAVRAAMADSEALDALKSVYPGSFHQAIKLVGQKVAGYELPLYILESNVTESNKEDIYEGIAEIFTRVNSAGEPIGNLGMFLSFFAAAFPREAKDKIIDLHEHLSESFGLDLEPIIRFVFSKMGMNQNQITKVKAFKPAIRELKQKYDRKQKTVIRIIEKAGSSINVILKLLEIEFGICSSHLLPSQIALLPLFEYAFNREVRNIKEFSIHEKRRMLRWFLITSFNGMYSSSPNKKLEEDLEIIQNHRRFPIDQLMQSMKRRIRTDRIEKENIFANSNVLRGRTGKEYLMLLDVLLHRNRATDWAGKLVKSEETAIHHIFPREILKEEGIHDEKLINCLANLTLINPSINSEICDQLPSNYLPEFAKQETVLEQHFIPRNRKIWNPDKYDEFLDARLALIWKATKDLLVELS